MKSKFFLAATAAVLAASSSLASAEVGVATAEVTILPPGLSIVEVQPYQMQIERAPGATMPTGAIQLTKWASNGIARDPAETVIPGCLKVAGDVDKAVGIGIESVSPLAAPNGAQITFRLNPKIKIGTSSVDCSDAIASGLTTELTLGGAPSSATTASTGELYVAWQYANPTSGASGFMELSGWEEGQFTGTVDVGVDYQ